MNLRYHVELTEAERCELTALVSGGEHPVRKLKRAQILLAADVGLGASACLGRRPSGFRPRLKGPFESMPSIIHSAVTAWNVGCSVRSKGSRRQREWRNQAVSALQRRIHYTLKTRWRDRLRS